MEKTSRGGTFRSIISALLALGAVACFVLALMGFRTVRSFDNPIAFTASKGHLYVLEKDGNRILKLCHRPGAEHMLLRQSESVEPDEDEYYYMVRKLYPGKDGVVVHSYIYRKDTEKFQGYRFREYRTLKSEPEDILTVFLEKPEDVPEMAYARGEEGHFFVNNCAGQRNIWKIPEGSGALTMREGIVPEGMVQMGITNTELSCWGHIVVGANSNIYITCNSSDKVVEYDSSGEMVRGIARTGFELGELLAPDEESFIAMDGDEHPLLTVASTGNRTWVQFDGDGHVVRAIAPLEEGYPFPDIMVALLYRDNCSGCPASFDLVNKALVLMDDGFHAICTYRATSFGRTLWLVALGLLLVVLFVVRGRLFNIMDRLRFPFFLKLICLLVPMLVLSAYVVSDRVTDMMENDLMEESKRRSANLAFAIKNTIPVEDLEAIEQPEDRNSEIYEKIYATAKKLVDRKAVEDTPKWIIHKIRNGRFYFGINIWRGPIYEPFIVPRDRKMFFDVLTQKTCQYGCFTDEQGEWFSYLCPITNSTGRVINVIELYRPYEKIERTRGKAMERAANIAGITALIFVFIALLFSYVSTRPLAALIKATKRISHGDFSDRVDVRSRDELADVGRAFNSMAVDLEKYTADLARTTAEKERIQNELTFARRVQQGILPTDFPPSSEADSVEIFARMETAKEVGGDYYDFFMVDENHIGVVVADVSDKGVAAGLFMMDVRTILRTNAIGRLSAGEAIARTNEMIVRDNTTMMFVSMFYLICDIRTGEVVFCNAGHNPPVLVKKQKPEFLRWEDGKGPMAGVIEGAEYGNGRFVFEEGEYIVLYTDGVTECSDKDKNMYGEQRLLDCLENNAGMPNDQVCDSLFDELGDFYTGVDQFDDITVVFFRFLGRNRSGVGENAVHQQKTEFIVLG